MLINLDFVILLKIFIFGLRLHSEDPGLIPHLFIKLRAKLIKQITNLNMKYLFLLFFGIIALSSANAQFLANSICNNHYNADSEFKNESNIAMKGLFLHKATGDLQINGIATKSPYQVYFVLPIATREQSPIWLEIECADMINYRFVRLDALNVFVTARLNNSSATIHLKWTSWVLTKQHDYSGIPDSVPIPSLIDIPDSVKPWLMPTGCVQWEDPFVKHIADSIRGNTNDLIELANRINNYCKHIPFDWLTEPVSWDAYYAMKWGNSCTGHAHAAAAIFRANGVPCRVLLNIPTWITSRFDMHWIIEYYIPQYGWVKMETTNGNNPYTDASKEIITFACNPDDEFSMTFPDNIESYWFTSDTVFQHFYPDWNGAHFGKGYNGVLDSSAKVDLIISLTDSVYNYFTTYKGIELTAGQSSYFQTATDFQYKAFNAMKALKTDSLIYYLYQSLNDYRKILPAPLYTIFFDDFENGLNGWTHGGIKDEWELGAPTNIGPMHAYSENNCWGTDLDDKYEDNADCWLLSPSINLNSMACAYLSVKIWNDVEDSLQGYSPKDRLWIELSNDGGNTFSPISTFLGGVIDFNTGVPQVGGWSRLVLDITPYINTTLKLRFHFSSNSSVSRPGSYIDNVYVYGRELGTYGNTENGAIENSINIYPNPAKTFITIEMQKVEENCLLSVCNINGQEMMQQKIIKNRTQFDIRNLKSGIYFIKLFSKNGVSMEKLIKE